MEIYCSYEFDKLHKNRKITFRILFIALLCTDPGSFKLTDISYRFSFVSFACIVCLFFVRLRFVHVIGSFVSFVSLIRRMHETNERAIHETDARFTRSRDTYK